MKLKKQQKIFLILSVILFSIITYLYVFQLPTIKKEDVIIEGEIKSVPSNKAFGDNRSDYIINLYVKNKTGKPLASKNSFSIIYPYLGDSPSNIDDVREYVNKRYLHSKDYGIGSDGELIILAENELKSSSILINQKTFIESQYGVFRYDNKDSSYRYQIALSKDIKTQILRDACVIYTYKEEVLFKKFTWAKIVRLKYVQEIK